MSLLRQGDLTDAPITNQIDADATVPVVEKGQVKRVPRRMLRGQASADGAAGAAGTDGAAGAAGQTGQAGAAGRDGKDGAPGPAGPAGQDGAAGARGPAGADGAPGPKGDSGAKGDAGAQGPAGAKGDTGAAGAKGDAGTAGAAGPAGAAGKDAEAQLRMTVAVPAGSTTGRITVVFSPAFAAGVVPNVQANAIKAANAVGSYNVTLVGEPTSGGCLLEVAVTSPGALNAVLGILVPSVAFAPAGTKVQITARVP